jgi:2-dehydropantoate 2-reductase
MSDRPAAQVSVVGAGGIGCALGHALRAGGIDVTFVETDEQKLDWGRRHGVGLDGQPSLPAEFVAFADWRPQPDGIVLLCTKCYDNKTVLSRLPSTTEVIPVQNGFDHDLVERSRIEGISSFVSECHARQTRTRITRPGSLHIGYSGPGNQRALPDNVNRLIGVLEQHGSFDVKLAAVAGLDNSQLLTIKRARRLFFRLLRENYGILKAAGVPLGIVGPFHPDTVNRILRMPVIARLMAWPFSRSLRNTYCSMSGDIPTGHTEIDYFNGHLIELAGARDIPLNRLAYNLVRRMERERATPAPHWLDQLVDAPRAAALAGEG